MATVKPSVRIVKTFTFKGGLRTYSNRYFFNGGTPADSTHWHTLFDNIVTAEKAVHDSPVTIVEALGYAAGSDVAVDQKTYTTAGTFAAGSGVNPAPGEVAALVRFATAARSVKNHPIYCFNYFHHAMQKPSVDWDKLDTALKTALETYAAHWISGFSDGGGMTAVRCSPAGHVCTGYVVDEYLTHRDFPYTRSV